MAKKNLKKIIHPVKEIVKPRQIQLSKETQTMIANIRATAKMEMDAKINNIIITLAAQSGKTEGSFELSEDLTVINIK